MVVVAWLIGVGQSEGPEPVSHGSSDPMREAGAPNTRKLYLPLVCSGVHAPPGIGMVAPQTLLRNAEGRKVKAALVEDDPVPQYNAANNTSIIEARAP